MSKIYDGIMGLVVGDALGVPVEFEIRDTFSVTDMIGFGTHDQPPGTWSDDSSMTLATLESIGRLGEVNANDIMMNFVDWFKGIAFTPHGSVFDIGLSTRNAILRYTRGIDPANCGGKNLSDNGNGALMRILPVAMFPNDPNKQVKLLSVAHLTHAHCISDYGCLVYAAIVENLMCSMGKEESVKKGVQRFQHNVETNSLLADYSRLPDIQYIERNEIKSSGYVVDTLEAAIWCFLNTKSYRECVFAAVNLGNDTDTIAAVAGSLAGILYGCGGETGIPEEWLCKIARKDWIDELCRKYEVVLEKEGNNL